jgi:hypothetical protein
MRHSHGSYAVGILLSGLFLAACAGVQQQSIECANNFDCEATHYCVADTCGGPGSCVVRPTDCSPNVSFVCGCDGVTYDNACEASKAGARIATESECTCENNDDCDSESYCDGESCGGSGTCEPKPTECPEPRDPVCGCDGLTYHNECVAESLGARIGSLGACACEGNEECDATQYCEAATCGGPGECVPRPTSCAPIVSPVCGCDGVTYDNACLAMEAGARVAVLGPCCADNGDCTESEYCVGDTCDGLGTCEERPSMCPLIFDPVCGCDGAEYGNACSAASSGVRVEFDGPCP